MTVVVTERVAHSNGLGFTVQTAGDVRDFAEHLAQVGDRKHPNRSIADLGVLIERSRNRVAPPRR